MAFKLDMSKAYDRVECGFLEVMMLQMGFVGDWVTLVMRCTSSVTYLVNVNGVRGRSFKPLRGLRQRDPLIPFLFLICSEELSLYYDWRWR